MANDDTALHDDATVAASDIARLAGVGKAAVSNWRRRHADFPKPAAGTAASPLYRLSDVEEWLARHGRAFELQPADRVWQQIRGTVDDLQLGDLVGFVGAVLVLRERAPSRWQTLARLPDADLAAQLIPAVTDLVADLPDRLPSRWDTTWLPIVRVAVDAAADQGAHEVFETLFERYAEVHSRRLSPTSDPTGQLITALADATRGTVLDPACGTGSLLLAAHAAGATRLLGQELDPAAARIAAVRLVLAGATARIVPGDTLLADAFAEESADAVVCDPPWGVRSWGYDELINDPRWAYGLPSRSEPELAWVQHCLARVRPGGYAVVVMPAQAANRRSGRRMRSNLIRSGALRAVIGLMGTTTGAAPPDAWVLQHPEVGRSAPSHVFFGDAAGDSASVLTAWHTFVTDPAAQLPAGVRILSIIDLLDDEIDVGPRRHLTRQPVAAQGMGYDETRASLLDGLHRLAGTAPLLRVSATKPPTATTTLGELVKTGIVTVHQAPLKMDVEDGPDSVLTARDVRRGRPASGAAIAGAGMIRTASGDVVIALGSRDAVVRVVSDADALLGPQLLLLRTDPDRMDPYFLAGHLHVSQHDSGVHSVLTSSRTDVYRTVLPRLALTEQRAYGAAFRQLMAFDDDLRQVTAHAQELIRLGFAGLAGGNLSPPVGVD
jgi:SAM-dependent methyltransferase